MDYIYDIVLNFQNNYYDFYEWRSTDKIINIKKILIYKVNNKDYLDLKYNDVIIDKNKIPHQEKMILVTNGIEVMGLLLDNEGKVIKRSSLLIDESDEVLEEKETIKSLPLIYKKNNIKPHISNSRIYLEKKKFLKNYFSNIDKIKDEYLLKYIYYDIYNKEENDINKIYQNLQELISNDINKIYNSINKINLELKK